jgi:hypothetical protein
MFHATCMKQYAPPSYAHIVIQMSITNCAKLSQNFVSSSYTDMEALVPMG